MRITTHMLNRGNGLGLCGVLVDYPTELMSDIGHEVTCFRCIAILYDPELLEKAVNDNRRIEPQTDRVSIRIGEYNWAFRVDKQHDVWSESEYMKGLILKMYSRLCQYRREVLSEQSKDKD